MKNPDELLAIFERHFKQGMINKDFNAFKRSHPTLLKVIKNTLAEINNPENKKNL